MDPNPIPLFVCVRVCVVGGGGGEIEPRSLHLETFLLLILLKISTFIIVPHWEDLSDLESEKSLKMEKAQLGQ